MTGRCFWDSKIRDERVLRAVLHEADARDTALLLLLYEEGLSAAEVSAFDLAHCSQQGKVLHVRARESDKRVLVSDAVLEALLTWVRERGKAPGPLFMTGNSVEPRRLSAAAIQAMVIRKSKWDGVIVRREVEGGHLNCYDKNGRLCWDMTQRERVVLVEDLRRHALGLHVGALGWTLPDSCDAYRWVDVEFDNGVRLTVDTYHLARVLPECAQSIADEWIAFSQGTMHDADPTVAEKERAEYMRSTFGPYVDAGDVLRFGRGPEEVYAFTFPSLVELASLKGEKHYPVKVGYTRSSSGAAARISEMMNWAREGRSLPEGLEARRGPGASVVLGWKSIATVGEAMGESSWVESAGYPERARLLLVCATYDGRALETAIHRELRRMGRRLETAVGTEWYRSNAEELKELLPGLLGELKREG